VEGVSEDVELDQCEAGGRRRDWGKLARAIQRRGEHYGMGGRYDQEQNRHDQDGETKKASHRSLLLMV